MIDESKTHKGKEKEMKSWQVDVPTVITEQRVADVLIGAIDGDYGSSWPWINTIKTYPVKTHGDESTLVLPARFVVEDGTEHELSEESIREGLEVLADKYTWHLTAIITESDDAETSDALLQCCLLGDIVYS